jgi:hypothetical protein
MSTLSANDLKTGGVAAIEAALSGQPEAIISVRGKDRFVVMDVAHYHYLRECELDAALAQSQADVAAGRFVAESAQAHAARLDALLAAGELAPGQRKAAKSVVAKVPAKAPAKRVATQAAPRRKA